MTEFERLKIRKLDVQWVHQDFEQKSGQPFVAGPSSVMGKWSSADENALMALHKMRLVVGNKAEARASREWLRAEGLNGLFEAPLFVN